MKKVYRFIFLFSFFIFIIVLTYINLPLIEDIEEKNYINPSLDIVRLNANLYFVGKKGIESEVRTMIVKNEAIETTMIQNLAIGAKNRNYKSVFDFDFSINDIETFNNVCYINLNINKNGYSLFNNEDFYLYIWSLVNTVTEKEDVLRVQILFNGEKFNKELLGYNLRDPLPRLEWLLYQKVEYPIDIVNIFIDYIFVERYDLAYGLLSEISKEKVSYNEFKILTNEFISEIKNYNKIIAFTQKYNNYSVAVYKYENLANEYIYKNWRIILEDGFYKISLENSINDKKK